MSAPDKPEKKSKKAAKEPGAARRISTPWLVIIVLVIFSIFMVVQYHDARNKQLAATPAAVSHQTDDIVARVRKLILLPSGEKPQIYTVNDVAKLKGEAFYADAQKGDVTLIYAHEKRAILYRPSANIIVNVANVTITSNQ